MISSIQISYALKQRLFFFFKILFITNFNHLFVRIIICYFIIFLEETDDEEEEGYEEEEADFKKFIERSENSK